MKKYIFSILFLLIFCRLSYAGAISVSSFITADDVTVAHLETMRSTFQGAINSADGGLLQTATVTAAKLDANTNPENRWNEAFNDFVYTGLTIPTSASLSSTTTSGTAYVYGTRVVKDATAHTYTASKHTYVDLSNNGTYSYSEVAINASAPSVAANSIRLAKVSTDTSTVLSVTDLRVTSVTSGVSTTYKAGTFTRDMTAASGDVAYTGVGFTPTLIIFFGGTSSSGIATYNGVDNGAVHYCLLNYLTAGAGYSSTSTSQSIYLAETVNIVQRAYVKTFDSDGFTLTWTKDGSPSAGTANIFYIAFK